MNEKNRKAEEIEQEATASRLIEQDLDDLAGGTTGAVGGIDIIVKKKPGGGIAPPPPGSTGGL